MISSFTGEYRFLSNFHPCDLYIDGIEYPTAEHAFQAAKTSNVRDKTRIARALTPTAAKHMGRAVRLRADWEAVKIGVMADILAVKFAPTATLASSLIVTQRHMLVEGNNWNDTFWGVCRGEGQNWLGRLLMLQRALLRAT